MSLVSRNFMINHPKFWCFPTTKSSFEGFVRRYYKKHKRYPAVCLETPFIGRLDEEKIYIRDVNPVDAEYWEEKLKKAGAEYFVGYRIKLKHMFYTIWVKNAKDLTWWDGPAKLGFNEYEIYGKMSLTEFSRVRD